MSDNSKLPSIQGKISTLCYGDIIAFGNPEDEDSFIFGDGFLKSKLKMKGFKDDSKSDFSSCIFQIYPQFVNNTKKQAQNFQEELKKSKNAGQKKKEMVEEMQEKLTDEYSFNLQTFEKHKSMSITYGKIVQFLHIASNKFLAVEYVEANIEKENYKVQLVEYSSESTFFKILPSFKYQKESEGKIFTEDIIHISHATAYMNKTPFLHCSKTKQILKEKNKGPNFFKCNENDIKIHSQIDQNSNSIRFNPSNIEDSMGLPNPKDFLTTEQQKKIMPLHSKSNSIEINISLDLPTRWRIHLYSKYKDDNLNEFLYYGDVIWLNNFEKKITLITSKFSKQKKINESSSAKKEEENLFNDKADEENLKILFTELVVSEESLDYVGNTNGMWVIEKENSNKGGIVEIVHYFRLKHLTTGKYLSAKAFLQGSPKKRAEKYEIRMTKDKDDSSLFWFFVVQAPKPKSISAQEAFKFISKDSFILIKHKKSNFWLGITKNNVDISKNIYKPCLVESEKEEDVLKIARATSYEILETNFLQSCKNMLKRYISFLFILEKKTITDYEIKLAEGKAKTVQKCLLDLELFVTNQLFNTSPYTKYGSINQRRQKILKEQYYIELLIQLLLVSIKKSDLEKFHNYQEQMKEDEKKGNNNNSGSPLKKMKMKGIVSLVRQKEKQGDNIKQRDDKYFLKIVAIKLRIVKLIFKLFIHVCRGMSENEQYVFEFIPYFNYYFEYIPNSIDFLISLVRNNDILMKRLGKRLSVLTPAAIEKLHAIFEIELLNQGDPNKESNVLYIANILKNQMKKNDMIDEFTKQIKTEEGYTSVEKDEEFKIMKNNLILLFSAIAKKISKKERSVRILKFFRTICSFDHKGLTSNQEILFKILKNEMYANALMMKITIENQVMRVETTEGKSIFLDEIFDNDKKKNFSKFNKELNNYITDLDETEKDFLKGTKSEVNSQIMGDKGGATSMMIILREDELEDNDKEKNQMIAYLNEQICFYADVCMGRNYIWKKYLESVFSIQFVFSQIYNKKLFKETRSAFTKLALNLYIDQEPLTDVFFPRLCRIYHEINSKEKDAFEDKIDKAIFNALLNDALAYIGRKSLKINTFLTNLDKKTTKGKENNEKEIEEENKNLIEINQNEITELNNQTKNYLNNILLYDITVIISKLLNFNLFNLINEEQKYLTVFPNLTCFLEFDFNNPLISYCIMNMREKNFNKLKLEQEKKKNVLVSGISNLKSIFSDVMENVTGLTKEMAGTLLGGGLYEQKKKIKTESGIEKYNEAFLYSHPIMRGCISQRNELNLLTSDEDIKVVKVEKELKILICDILKRFLTMRRDFLISNLIAWYRELAKNKENCSETKLKQEIDENLTTILPDVMLTGISILDDKYQIKIDDNLMNKVGSNFKNIVGNVANLITNQSDNKYLIKKFKVYTTDPEIKDLDCLETGIVEENLSCKKAFFPSLIMMFFLTHDSRLESKLLELITRCFNQRFQFAESLKNLEILFDKSDVDNYLILSKHLLKLRGICEKSEIWFGEWMNTCETPKEIKEIKKILNFLIKAFYSKSMESESLIDENEGELEPETEKYILINSVRQKICFFLGFHQVLLDFIKDTTHLFEKILKDDRFELFEKMNFLSLYHKIFTWLRYFVKDNPHNQEILHEELEQFFFHIDLDLGQIDVICEIFKNNQTLCENVKSSLIFDFISFICKIGRREKFLSFFETIQICNNSYVFESQSKIVNSLFYYLKNSDFDVFSHLLYSRFEGNSLIFDFESKPLPYYMKLHKTTLSHKLRFNESLYGDQPFKYHAKVLQVLSLASQGIHGFNLNNARLRKIFDMSYVFILLSEYDSLTKTSIIVKEEEDKEIMNLTQQNDLKSPKNFSRKLSLSMKKARNLSKASNLAKDSSSINILKPALLHYLLEIYLPTIKKEKENFNAILSNIVIYFNREFDRISLISKTEIRDENFVNYFFGGFLKFANLYIQQIIAPNLGIDTLDRKDNEKLCAIADLLKDKIIYLEELFNIDKYKNFKDFMMIYYENIPELKESLAKTLASENVEKRSYSNSSINSEIFDEGLDNSFSWKAFLKLIFRSEALEKEINKEKTALCETIIKIQHLFDPEDKKKYNINVEMKFILVKLIRFVEYAISNKGDKRTIIFTLQILINIVKIYPKKVEIQNILDQNNATTMILNVVSESKTLGITDDILDYLLSFLIALLEEGNTNVQKTIYSYFITIPSSEFFFEKLHRTISEQIELIKTKKQDNVTTSSAPKKKKNNELETLKKTILEKMLRIMQLFTEGHNLELQIYLKEQTHSRNSYDMVSLVIELLYAYNTDMNNSNYENILRCLETLTEFVQGPCTENQNALIDGKFLDVAYAILTAHTRKNKDFSRAKGKGKTRKTTKKKSTKNKEEKKKTNIEMMKPKAFLSSPVTPQPQIQNKKETSPQIKRWKLERLKYKCMILINSLLEMKKGYNIVTRIIRSLPLEALKRNLSDIYRRYKKLYPKNLEYLCDEALKHYDGEPEERNNTILESHYEFIVETGFLTFFLINEYLELINDSELHFQDDIKKSSGKSNILKGSVLGQFGSLAMTLMKSGLDTVSVMKNAVNQNLQKLMNSGADIDKDKIKKEMRAIELKQLLIEAMKFFDRNSGHIEVLRNKNLEKVYFTLPTYCHFLPEETKLEFDENVDRDSLETKLNALNSNSKNFIEIAKHEETLLKFFNRYKVLAIFASYVGLWKEIAFLSNIVLNILIIFSFSDFSREEVQYSYFIKEVNGTKINTTLTETTRWERRMYEPHLFHNNDYSVADTQRIIRNLGIVMIVCANFVVLFFLCKKAPLYIKQAWGSDVVDADEDSDLIKKKKPFSIRTFQFLKRVAICFIYFFQNFDVIYYFAYAALAILAVVVHEFFFCFHLTELFMRFPTLKNVIRAVYEPRKALFLTLILLIILEYVFSLWGFRFLREYYINTSIDEPGDNIDYKKSKDGFCTTLLLCFFYTFDFTFKANGGIGRKLEELQSERLKQDGVDKFTVNKFGFDNLFTIIIFFVMITIVAGIIIDTFGLLRDQENYKTRDREKICFICGLNKEIFDRQVDGGFAFHIKKEHYIWNYVYYIAYLLDKDQNEYTGIESYIREKKDNADLGWYPSFKALALKNLEQEGEEKQKDLIKKFENEMSELKINTEGIKDIFVELNKN